MANNTLGPWRRISFLFSCTYFMLLFVHLGGILIAWCWPGIDVRSLATIYGLAFLPVYVFLSYSRHEFIIPNTEIEERLDQPGPEEPEISVQTAQEEDGTYTYTVTATATSFCTTITAITIMRETANGKLVTERRPLKFVTKCKEGKVEKV